jgi:hypothetical protein
MLLLVGPRWHARWNFGHFLYHKPFSFSESYHHSDACYFREPTSRQPSRLVGNELKASIPGSRGTKELAANAQTLFLHIDDDSGSVRSAGQKSSATCDLLGLAKVTRGSYDHSDQLTGS